MAKSKIPISKYLALTIILSFAALQFLLILRHKSPYLSDSYFYLHQYYQIKGATFDQAYEQVKSQIPREKLDTITTNIFDNKQAYQNSYEFFAKRPLYPALAALVSQLFKSPYLSLMTPMFLSYMGTIVLFYLLIKKNFSPFFSIFAIALLASFYPFLDYSTYFLTDTISAFFWFAQLFAVYKFTTSLKNIWFTTYAAIFVLSLLNREQSVLFVPLLGLAYLFAKRFQIENSQLKQIIKLLKVTLAITIAYFIASYTAKHPTLLDTINYTHNSYGLTNMHFTTEETLKYLVSQAVSSHMVIFKDLTRNHWWFVIAAIGAASVLKFLFLKAKGNLIDILFVCSTISSYLFIFVFPDFSYRYYYPAVIGIIYFATRTIEQYFKNYDSTR